MQTESFVLERRAQAGRHRNASSYLTLAVSARGRTRMLIECAPRPLHLPVKVRSRAMLKTSGRGAGPISSYASSFEGLGGVAKGVVRRNQSGKSWARLVGGRG